jgi:hypothetical protein
MQRWLDSEGDAMPEAIIAEVERLCLRERTSLPRLVTAD